VHDLRDVGVEEVAVGSLGSRPGIDRPSGDLRLTRPLRLRALDRSAVALCRANRGSRRRSAPLRAFGIEPEASSPSLKAASIPEIRGEPLARKVAIVLCLCASKKPPLAMRDLRRRPLDVLPRRHPPTVAPELAPTRGPVPRTGPNGSGRSREATAPADPWPNVSLRPVSTSWTCPAKLAARVRSSTPAKTTARPMPATPTPSRSSRSAPRHCVSGAPTVSSKPRSPRQWHFTFDGQTLSLSLSMGNWSFRSGGPFMFDPAASDPHAGRQPRRGQGSTDLHLAAPEPRE